MREKGKGTMEKGKEKYAPQREDKGLTASGQRGDRHGPKQTAAYKGTRGNPMLG